jgi:hypothetical protein
MQLIKKLTHITESHDSSLGNHKVVALDATIISIISPFYISIDIHFNIILPSPVGPQAFP